VSAESVHVHAPEVHVPASLQPLSAVHTNPVDGEEKLQGIPTFRDFRIRDPRYFVIWFQALIS
jgi:hypothetical protein